MRPPMGNRSALRTGIDLKNAKYLTCLQGWFLMGSVI
jgi:hypothetical protein